MTKMISPNVLAPYESGCELTHCDGCSACDGYYAKPKPTKPARTTKQGVRDLSAGTNQRKHEHRYAPVTFTSRNGFQMTQMKCFCGDVETESDAAKEVRETAERERDLHARLVDEDLRDDYW